MILCQKNGHKWNARLVDVVPLFLYTEYDLNSTQEVSSMSLGTSLYQARRKSGLSQEEVAEKLGVSRQTVSKWELEGGVECDIA